MAGVLGDLDLSDEGMHPIEDHPHFNESMLFTFFDKDGDSGALLRIGNRPNEAYAQVTLCVFPREGGALFQFTRAPIEGNDRFDAAGLRFTVRDPGEEIHIAYRGEVARLVDPRELRDPGPAFRRAPRVSIELDVVGHALGPMYGARSGTSVGGHYEQHMSWTGTLTADGESVPVAGVGNRDHSWGPRTFHTVHRDRTLWCTFSPDSAFAVSLTWGEDLDAPPDVLGTLFQDGIGRPIVRGTIESEYEDDGLFHKALTGSVADADGRTLEFTGRVVRFIPFRHKGSTHLTHIGQGMTEFVSGTARGYGLSEYMDLVR